MPLRVNLFSIGLIVLEEHGSTRENMTTWLSLGSTQENMTTWLYPRENVTTWPYLWIAHMCIFLSHTVLTLGCLGPGGTRAMGLPRILGYIYFVALGTMGLPGILF